MRTVKVFYKASDNCGPVTTVLSVTSNEDQLKDPEEDEPGSDYQVLDNHTVKLRAARSGAGNGRIYTITITATDASGNVSAETVTVLVPHDRSELDGPSSGAISKKQAQVHKLLQVTALPNPSKNQFSLLTRSSSNAPVLLRVIDNVGRLIETGKSVLPNGTYTLGQHYSPGTYYVEVIQGATHVVLKLIKQ
jgi:hypothetical protein